MTEIIRVRPAKGVDGVHGEGKSILAAINFEPLVRVFRKVDGSSDFEIEVDDGSAAAMIGILNKIDGVEVIDQP